MGHVQKLAINNKSTIFVQSLWKSVKVIASWDNHFRQFYKDWTKIVDFLLMTNFWTCPVLFTQTLCRKNVIFLKHDLTRPTHFLLWLGGYVWSTLSQDLWLPKFAFTFDYWNFIGNKRRNAFMLENKKYWKENKLFVEAGST